MTTPSIDNVSDEVAKLLADIEKDKSKAKQTREANRQRVEQARPLLRQIWDELDANRPVKGCTTKQEWVEKFGKTTIRNCQYILKGGNKNRPDANRSVRAGFLARIADAKKKVGDIQRAWEAPLKEGETRDGRDLDQIDAVLSPVYKEFLALIAPDGYEVVKGRNGWSMMEKDEEPAKPVAPKKKKVKRYSQKVDPSFLSMPGKPKKTHKMQPGGRRTWCGKTLGDTLAIDAKMSDAPTCRQCQNGEHMDEMRKQTTEKSEAHTGQHEDCAECFEVYQTEQALEKKRNAAWGTWSKRLQTLINTWRNGRLKDVDKYRAEFDKASAVYEKKMKTLGKAYLTANIILEARGRMEGAIKDRNRFNSRFQLSEPAQALAAAVDGAGVQKVRLKPLVEGEHGTKLRTEAGFAAYGEKKVSKKVYERILADLEKYQEYHWTQKPEVPERPENATVVCEGDDDPTPGRGSGMILSTSPEYDAWEAARMVAEATPKYRAWNNERTLICELESALIQRYDPLLEGDLDGDDGECDDGEAL